MKCSVPLHPFPRVQVSFGVTVDCPTCRKAFAVVQPQQGRQVVGCAGCKYEYELVSGDLISCDSESLIDSAPILDKTLALLRAPPKATRDSGSLSLPPWVLPLGGALVAANVVGAAAVSMGIMEPNALTDGTMGSVVGWVAAGGAATGGAYNFLLLPKLRELPGSVVDGMAVRQQLLEQHAALRQRLEALSAAAAEEVRMLARMCQLQNKMQSIGQPSTYSARWERVVAARKGLDQRLLARINLVDSYAKVLSMIEIEVEMDADVPTAEAAGAAASIADQIERLMEVESLQKEWKQQAEVNDELERLLRSAPALPDSASWQS
ncbi:unnamed protein product [Closterium sp. Yama58-4]|nr:unnamed protein product [Closterium sp. Yama58-4]